MKKLILSIALFVVPFASQANPNNFNTPNFNWGNGNNNGSSWNMPNMNWGNNNNGYSNGSNWNMPNMNWGNNNSGSNWNMPNMGWGNNNGYGNRSNWNMPSMNWGNGNNSYSNGSNWNMPSMNWGNNNQPWNFGNNGYAPNNQRWVPAMPVAPQFIPQATIQAPITKKPAKPIEKTAKASTPAPTQKQIPMPSQVKGVILAPENKPALTEGAKKE